LGETYARARGHERREARRRQALALFRRIGAAEAANVSAELDALPGSGGHLGTASESTGKNIEHQMSMFAAYTTPQGPLLVSLQVATRGD
jgi:hypothetical protein